VPLTSMAIAHEPEIQKAIQPFDTLLLGEGPGDALGLLVRRIDGTVYPRYAMADIGQSPVELVAVPVMVPGYNFGLADIWNNLDRGAVEWGQRKSSPDYLAEFKRAEVKARLDAAGLGLNGGVA
jgi:hypothetical protein